MLPEKTSQEISREAIRKAAIRAARQSPGQTKKGPKPGMLTLPTEATSKGWHHLEPFTICPKEFQLKRVRGIRLRGVFMPEPLAIGLIVHAGHAQWLHDGYQGELWRGQMVKYLADLERRNRITSVCLPLATRCMEGYVKHWSVRPRPQVLAVEHELGPKPLIKGAPEWTWRSARLDSIVSWRKQTWIKELKTTSSTAGRVRNLYMLHGQPLLQVALWGEEETARFGPLAGVLLDSILKPSGRREARGTDLQPLPIAQMQVALKWFRNDFTLWVMQSSAIVWNSQVERRPVCVRAQSACDFRAMCLRGRAGSNSYVFEDGSPVSAWAPSPGKEVPPWE